MLRLFFALQPTAKQSAALLARTAPVVEKLQGQRVPAENLHATLCFVGAVAEERLDELRAAAATVRAPALKLRFEQLEFWDKPRVLCATGTRESDAAHDLARRLAEAAIAAGFAPDIKPFRAHLTLARKVNAAEAAKVEWPRGFSPAMTVRCDRFVLMQSRREEGGSIYSAVDSWALDDDESR
jgi:2'-5' RNA ligase